MKILPAICFSILSAVIISDSCTKQEIVATAPNSAPAQQPSSQLKSILEILKQYNPQFSILEKGFARTGLDTLLDKRGPYLLLACRDVGFWQAGLFPEQIDSLPLLKLRTLLLNLIIPGDSTLFDDFNWTVNRKLTAAGDSIFSFTTSSFSIINGVYINSDELPAFNGSLLPLNRLIVPPATSLMETLSVDPAVSFFHAALERTYSGSSNLTGLLSGQIICTVFVPSNQAFRNAGFNSTIDFENFDPDSLARILAYHIIEGRKFQYELTGTAGKKQYKTINGQDLTIDTYLVNSGWEDELQSYLIGNGNPEPAKIIYADKMATNGIFHIINKVLFP